MSAAIDRSLSVMMDHGIVGAIFKIESLPHRAPSYLVLLLVRGVPRVTGVHSNSSLLLLPKLYIAGSSVAPIRPC